MQQSKRSISGKEQTSKAGKYRKMRKNLGVILLPGAAIMQASFEDEAGPVKESNRSSNMR
jgi:hypothetical protein